MGIMDIERLTIDEAREIALETMEIKGHECIFVNFEDAFGYSVLVFKNGNHVHYANNYELHHGYIARENGRDALRDYYINKMNNILFTDKELLEDVKTYDEYVRKSYFLRNYWIMRHPYLTIFAISKEDREYFNKEKAKFPFFDNVSFCYVQNRDIVDEQNVYLSNLEKSFAKLQENPETFRVMVRSELANHEACITCDYTDALNSLGLEFDNLTEEKKRIVKEELEKQIDSYY